MLKANYKWLLAFAFLNLLTLYFANKFAIFSPHLENSLSPYYEQILLLSGINIILAVSLNLVNGFTGQFSIGHAGFMSVGAYTSAVITTVYFRDFFTSNYSSVLFVIPLLAAGIVASLMGYLVGLPSLRLKGDYLAIVTLGFGEIIRVFFLNVEVVGGPRGLPGVPPLAGFGWIYSSAFFTFFIVWRIVKSRYGRSFVAVREDEIAAESMGVETTKVKVRAFIVGAFFAGIAGALFAHLIQIVSPAIFDFNKSFEIIIMVVFGGMGSLSGSVIAAVFLTVLKEALRSLKDYTHVDLRMVIYAFLLIVLMLSRPEGLMGRMELSDLWLKFKKRIKKVKGVQPS